MHAVKVLIVDEEPEFTSILADRLCSWGFAASAANSREEVLESLTASRPGVVVLGLQDRDTKGLDMLGMIKALDPAIEVILLVGKGAAIAGMRGMEQGAADCLFRPIELGVLIDKIRQVIGMDLQR
jgi:DNA-binding NtrC family response regulator